MRMYLVLGDAVIIFCEQNRKYFGGMERKYLKQLTSLVKIKCFVPAC